MKNDKITAAVDWGSSSFRAYRYDSVGQLVEKIDLSAGIKTLSNANFETVLLDNIGNWLQDGDAILLAGMITSRDGWIETPYLKCPLSLHQLAENSVRKNLSNGSTALFLPGVSAPMDVMRGEELQLYGSLTGDDQIVILPGTHSKWVYARSGVLEQFHTVVTGELFDLLINNSLIGGLATSTDWSELSFSNGVLDGFNSSAIISQLFSARSGVLLEQLKAQDVHSYLSGLLIGNEIRESVKFYPDVPKLLVGTDSLLDRYQLAFELLGLEVKRGQGDAAATGFQKLIKESRQ